MFRSGKGNGVLCPYCRMLRSVDGRESIWTHLIVEHPESWQAKIILEAAYIARGDLLR